MWFFRQKSWFATQSTCAIRAWPWKWSVGTCAARGGVADSESAISGGEIAISGDEIAP